MTALASIVIPAHDEEMALPAALLALLEDVPRDRFEVIVVANGCHDATADVARQMALELDRPITVLETKEAGKTAALNLGDSAATVFPRVYLDADVRCAATTILSLAGALSADSSELAVPSRVLDLSEASWWVRKYYQTWQDLPRVRQELSGRGAYAFSASGRGRFGRFPRLTADDHWAVRQVPRRRAVILEEPIVIRPPRRLGSLLAVRSRVYAANRGLHVDDAAAPKARSDLREVLAHPGKWVGAAVYVATNVWVKAVSSRLLRQYGRDPTRGVHPRAAGRR